MSAINDFLIWMTEEYPEVPQEVDIPPKYANEYLNLILKERELEETVHE